jgi:hypothetical protein
LHIRPVEIVVWACQGGEFELVPEVGTVVGNVVEVETGVDVEESCVDVVVKVTARLIRIRSGRYWSSWRELV